MRTFFWHETKGCCHSITCSRSKNIFRSAKGVTFVSYGMLTGMAAREYQFHSQVPIVSMNVYYSSALLMETSSTLSALGSQTFNTLSGKKPLGDNDTFKILLLFICNGCSPNIIAKWILTSQHWTTHRKGEKRPRQIDFATHNLTLKDNLWFYYDIFHDEWLHLNGGKGELHN